MILSQSFVRTPAGELPSGDHFPQGPLISSSPYPERENPRSLVSLTSKSVGRAIAMQRPRAEASSMSKVIEADFLPRNPEAGLSWLSVTGRPSLNGARRILVVDNDFNTTRLIKILLEKTGNYFVLPENDLAKAHQTARDFRPDLILLDIVMPEIYGGEVAARLRHDPELRRTPIIFLTALVTEAEAKSGLEIDGHSFLAKPINISELVGAIEQHLPHARKATN